ncbi:MAG: hypothetical protein KKI08_23660 [Armatimonadetes bacterium]|nr:hypothetical protein [Armatimonadota bacterium]
MLTTTARQDRPWYARRADPAYWHPAYDVALQSCRMPLRPLGDFITHLAYGPIITGRTPPAAPEGVALVNQGQIGPAGVDLREAVRVPEGCAWDRPSARLRAGDIVFARSGMGSLPKKRFAVFLSDEAAVVGSFVDIIRLDGLDPCYVMLYLKCELGWLQIHRLLNGVALPNISFDEIRGLRVALAPEELQGECRRRVVEEITPLCLSDPAEAIVRLQAAVQWLHGVLTGP